MTLPTFTPTGTRGTTGTIREMVPASATPAPIGPRYKSRAARDHFKTVLDEAERGSIAVVMRDRPVAAIDAAVLETLLADKAPFDIQTSVTDGQVAMWLKDGSVHAVGSTYDEAESQFVDALITYATDWLDDLRSAPNHAHNRFLVLRVALHAGDRDELTRVVFEQE